MSRADGYDPADCLVVTVDDFGNCGRCGALAWKESLREEHRAEQMDFVRAAERRRIGELIVRDMKRMAEAGADPAYLAGILFAASHTGIEL